MLNAAAGDGVM